MAFGDGGANTQQFRYVSQETYASSHFWAGHSTITGRTRRRLVICFQIVYLVLLCEAWIFNKAIIKGKSDEYKCRYSVITSDRAQVSRHLKQKLAITMRSQTLTKLTEEVHNMEVHPLEDVHSVSGWKSPSFAGLLEIRRSKHFGCETTSDPVKR